MGLGERGDYWGGIAREKSERDRSCSGRGRGRGVVGVGRKKRKKIKIIKTRSRHCFYIPYPHIFLDINRTNY